MRSLFFLLIIFSAAIQAQVQTNKAKVLVIDQNIDTTELAKKYTVEKPAPSNLSLPELKVRDKLFEGVQFPENWDELQKDMFYLELKSRPVNELIKKYPELKESDIKKLKGKVS